MDRAKQNSALDTVLMTPFPSVETVFHHAPRSWLKLVGRFFAANIIFWFLVGCQSMKIDNTHLVEGVAWQLHNNATDPRGNWQKIGANRLLIQWVSVDALSFLPDTVQPMAPVLPDWQRIAREPWAKEVILGLAGRFDENAARKDLKNLIDQSVRIAKLPTPLNVVGWYLPVEIDSNWKEPNKLGPMFHALPRPLWISVYDRKNMGAELFAEWLATWLPADIGVLFQDGVGVEARNAHVARQYMDALTNRLGKMRVSVIAEAFRPKPEGGFRSANFDEISKQLIAYRGLSVYLFDGPHYVSSTMVDALQNLSND